MARPEGVAQTNGVSALDCLTDPKEGTKVGQSQEDLANIECWLPCPDFEGLYEVSSLGRVRSLYFDPPRVIAQGVDRTDYPTVALSKDRFRTTKTVHRLVCRAFHGEPRAPHREAAHLDGVRTNCRADNLQWVGKVQNHFHMRAHGTHPAGERHGAAKLTAAQVREIRSAHGWRINAELGRKYGVNPSTIGSIRCGKTWRVPEAYP
jgi:hypothetical protein